MLAYNVSTIEMYTVYTFYSDCMRCTYTFTQCVYGYKAYLPNIHVKTKERMPKKMTNLKII